MNEPKLAAARVDAERLVRELLEAFNSLKRIPAPPTRSSPGEEEQQRPPQSQEGHAKTLKLVGNAPSTTSAGPRPLPRTPLEALTAVSNVDEGGSEQISAFEKSSRHEIIEEFRADHEVMERLRVTSWELQALSSASLLGSLTCKQDVLFMLRQIREAKKPAEPQATVPPDPLHLPDESIEPLQPSFSEMAERIRRESLAKLAESDSLRGTDRLSMLGHIGSAILFVASVVVGIFLRRSRPVTPSSGTI